MSSLILVTFWTGVSVSMVVAFLILKCGPVPQELEDLLFYGKLRRKTRNWSIFQSFEVPKRWFIHFYVIGFMVNALIFVIVTYSYTTGNSFPDFVWCIISWLNVGSNIRTVSLDSCSSMLLIALMVVHTARRLIECAFVSVYSPESTMNVAHYFLGFALYTSFSFVILVESPDPVTEDNGCVIEWRHLFAVVLFVWSSWHHNRTHISLANLRKSKNGDVVTYKHVIPHGGWFWYVSCPHYFAEILIYTSFLVISGGGHVTLLSVVLFVVTIHLLAGHLTHSWYCKQFGSAYPPNRKAVIPFIL